MKYIKKLTKLQARLQMSITSQSESEESDSEDDYMQGLFLKNYEKISDIIQ